MKLIKGKGPICQFSYYLRVYPNGIIEPTDLDFLQEYEFIKDIDGITRVEDLLGRYMAMPTDVDYSELRSAVEQHRINIEMRNKVLELTMLNLLYSKNTHPKNGYLRAKRMMRMFNKTYGSDLNMEELDNIMNIDYTDTEAIKQRIKKRGKK